MGMGEACGGFPSSTTTSLHSSSLSRNRTRLWGTRSCFHIRQLWGSILSRMWHLSAEHVWCGLAAQMKQGFVPLKFFIYTHPQTEEFCKQFQNVRINIKEITGAEWDSKQKLSGHTSAKHPPSRQDQLAELEHVQASQLLLVLTFSCFTCWYLGGGICLKSHFFLLCKWHCFYSGLLLKAATLDKNQSRMLEVKYELKPLFKSMTPPFQHWRNTDCIWKMCSWTRRHRATGWKR